MVNTARINWLCTHVLQVQVIVHEKEEFDFPQFNDVYGSDVSPYTCTVHVTTYNHYNYIYMYVHEQVYVSVTMN